MKWIFFLKNEPSSSRDAAQTVGKKTQMASSVREASTIDRKLKDVSASVQTF